MKDTKMGEIKSLVAQFCDVILHGDAKEEQERINEEDKKMRVQYAEHNGFGSDEVKTPPQYQPAPERKGRAVSNEPKRMPHEVSAKQLQSATKDAEIVPEEPATKDTELDQQAGEVNTRALTRTADVSGGYVSGELNLEVMGLFDAKYKRIKPTSDNPAKTISISNGTDVKVRPDPEYGFPNAEDFDFYRSFQLILQGWQERYPDWTISDPVIFSDADLLRGAKKTPSARAKKSARTWILRMAHTSIQGVISHGKGKQPTVAGGPSLFSKYYLRGDSMDGGDNARANHVWLSEWLYHNLFEQNYVTLTDQRTHWKCKNPISRVLTPICYRSWYLAKGDSCTLSYSLLCDQLGLSRLRYKSDILRQLTPPLREMTNIGVIADYAVTPSHDDWLLSLSPGKVYADYQSERSRRRFVVGIKQGKSPYQLIAAEQGKKPSRSRGGEFKRAFE